ncbi:hypothetical protein TTRE_0000283201 [Trichuris trichiura]|uniref:Uncharacterized protein n=1 Tax=Trichuris trichiura TaxID=36087 RepID=A0A077Z246_TRITR|nr:hypothetical protein TTRE_0000283201 [Trichuris trichiura]
MLLSRCSSWRNEVLSRCQCSTGQLVDTFPAAMVNWKAATEKVRSSEFNEHGSANERLRC